VGSDALARPVTVAVIEDLDVVTAGVRKWIAEDPDRRAAVTAVADTIDAVLTGPGRDADVLVLDLELGPRMVTDRIVDLTTAGHRVVVFSIHVKALIVQAVMAAGASAFLDKHTECDRFVDTVVAVARDEPFVTPSMAGGILQVPRLSEREREALLHLFQGMSHASIAHRMAKLASPGETISEHTVKDYIKRARAKYAAQGRPCASSYALLARCIEDGLIRPEEIEDYRSRAAAVGAS
jgi:two-component system, NarL family, nitrate/nitrite response regulator NarL